MTPVRFGEVLRSRTFWMTGLRCALAVLVAFLAVGITIAHFRNKWVERTIVQLDERAENLFADAVGQHFEEDLEPLESGLAEEDDHSLAEHLERLVTVLNARRARSHPDDPQRQVITGALALLGEEPEEALEDLPIQPLMHWLLDETPEPLHDQLESAMEAVVDLDELEANPLDTEAVRVFFEHAEIDDTQDCWWLVDARGQHIASNREGEMSEWHLDLHPLLVSHDEEDRLCVAREHELADGATLHFGRDASLLRQVEESQGFQLLIFLLGALMSLGWSWRRAASEIRSARRFDGALRAFLQGHDHHRVPVEELSGRDARLGASVNAVLDQARSRMESLRYVTHHVAHDLRTPLTRLQGQLDTLARTTSTPDAVEAVQSGVDQLLATFNALVRIAQVESGPRAGAAQRLDLARIIGDVGELYAPAFAEASLDFQYTRFEHPIEIAGDGDLLMQALSNLLDNALKYTPAGGRASLRCSPVPGEGWLLTIRDSGPGIPEADLGRVFERFHRADRDRSAQGSGLGLTLVKAICDWHGASIELRNEGGLVVSIVLPERAA
ncbi:MAG: HAMP domain-containing sensor histidine kinase [Acidobacteriota bacterium]